jgi:hypothetical protein
MLKTKVENLIFALILFAIVSVGFLPKQFQGKVEVLSLIVSTAILFFVKSFTLFNYHYPARRVLVFITLLVFFFYSTYRTGQYKPIFFLFFLFFVLYKKRTPLGDIRVYIHFFLLFLFILSGLLLFDSSKFSMGEQNRFLGFSISPTVFAVVIEAVMILGLAVVKSRSRRMLIISCTFLFVVLSKTRLNLILFLFVPFVPILERRSNSFRMFILIAFLLFLSLIYPLYDFLLQTEIFSGVLGSRYQDGRDASFGLRNALFTLGINILLESSIFQLLFGHGAEFSRLAIMEAYGLDLKIHNDFIVLLIDYGLLFTFYFLFKIVQIGAKNSYSFLAVVLYFISFYHNMVLSLFLLLIIFYASNVAGNMKISLHGLGSYE